MVTPSGILPGSRIGGKYEVVEVIGYGGMGVVYKVREQVGAVSRIRALKTVLPRHATNASIVNRFREEAEKMCLLEHENIVPVLSYSEEGEFPYLVMPFIEGRTLKEHLAAHLAKHGSGLPLKEVVEIGLQITRGLEIAHHFTNPETGKLQPIVHRDIKPGNIMVRVEGGESDRRVRVLIMDFGIAKLVSDEDTGHTLTDVIGTVKYASPEQVQRSKDIDPRADLYSLGMVLYELYRGKHVFSDLSEHGVLMRMMQRELEAIVPDFPAETPDAFRQLITRCLAVDREDRHADVTEMRADLRALEESERARRTDDSRVAEELATSTRSAALAGSADRLARSLWDQAERLAVEGKAAKDDSLHTEATQLFHAAATAFGNAADAATRARGREDIAARLGALRALRQVAAAADSASLASEEHAEAERASEAAERAFESDDLAAAARELLAAEKAWPEARLVAERVATRKEAEAERAKVDEALATEEAAANAVPPALRPPALEKKLAEARREIQAADASLRTDPQAAAGRLLAARAALVAAASAREEHLSRIADEAFERVDRRIGQATSASHPKEIGARIASLREGLASAQRLRGAGEITDAIRDLTELERALDALVRESEERFHAEAELAAARESAERARDAAAPFAEGEAAREAWARAQSAFEDGERIAESSPVDAGRAFRRAAASFEEAQRSEESRLQERLRALRTSSEASIRELRSAGERFASTPEARAAIEQARAADHTAVGASLVDQVRQLEPVPDTLATLVESARRELALERARGEAVAARDRALAADARARELEDGDDVPEMAIASRELRDAGERFDAGEWSAASDLFARAASRFESIVVGLEERALAARLRELSMQVDRRRQALEGLAPRTRVLRKRRNALVALTDRARASIEARDAAATEATIAEIEGSVDGLVRDVESAATAPPSRLPWVFGGVGAAAAAVGAGVYLWPQLPILDPADRRPTPQVALVATPAPVLTGAPVSTSAPRTDPTIAPAATVAAAPTAPQAPTPLPRLALASAEPTSRSLSLALGGSQRFEARVTGGAADGLVWKLDDREVARGASYVLDRKVSAKPGSHRLAVEGSVGGRPERLAAWSIEVEAPKLRFASLEPSREKVVRDDATTVDFSARLRPEDIEGIVYEWSVNGRSASRGSAPSYRFRPSGPGSYEVSLRASTPWGSALDNSWEVTIKAPATARPEARPTVRPTTAPAPTPIVQAKRTDPEADLRDWITGYCRAFERKDTDALLALGHLKSRAEAERLANALGVMKDLRLSCTNPSISVRGNEATVSFDRTDRWTDPRGNPVERTLPRITKTLRRDGSRWVVER